MNNVLAFYHDINLILQLGWTNQLFLTLRFSQTNM